MTASGWQQALFTQSAPELGNQYRDDPLLASWLGRALPAESLRALEPELEELGALAGGPLYQLQLADRLNEPKLTQWDAWGNRVDQVEVTPLWREAERVAVRHGLVATGYEPAHGRFARIAQFAKVYLFHPSSDVYSCPLAMTDGAARALVESGNRQLVDRALPRLTARDPALAWTSGQWMTETTGGSDVGRSQTRAVKDGDGWRLYGRKWFTSSVASQMALTLARPEGNAAGGKGLAMFYVELRDGEGRLNGLRVDRLKDKLGTRKVPTAELLLDGTRAELVGPPSNGTRTIEPMLAVTRMWNSVCAVAFMRRALALARSFAARREAFGAPLARQPLHVDTLAALEAETWGAFLMTFLLVELNGRYERGEIDAEQRALLRLVTPLAKLVTGKQAVSVVSEVVESFGGAGYVEDTGLPQLMRDAQVLPIWEGTTNVLSLDALLRSDLHAGLAALMGRASSCVRGLKEPRLAAAGRRATAARERAALWRESDHDRELIQAGARRLALTLARSLQLALLCEHAQWMLDRGGDRRGYAAALRFSRLPTDLMHELDPDLDRLLLG
ncbi:MAG: acyl-CoA dehydrogenase [Gammaproteobacteria bacterium]|nr:acyl-CoA dehydrogenase [Gammaproteobacteria bacterium]